MKKVIALVSVITFAMAFSGCVASGGGVRKPQAKAPITWVKPAPNKVKCKSCKKPRGAKNKGKALKKPPSNKVRETSVDIEREINAIKAL